MLKKGKTRKTISMLKKHERKKKRKDSPYFQKQSKREREAWQRSPNKKHKFPHTCTSWSKCMTCISLRSGFWLSNIVWCKYASLFIPTQAPHKPLEIGWKERQTSKAFGKDHTHIERSSVSFEELKFTLQNF